MSEKKILPGANIFSDEFKKPEAERWNLKEDPYVTATKRLEEAKKKPQPLRGTGMLALKVLEWVLRGSEGSLPEPEFTPSSGVEDSSISPEQRALEISHRYNFRQTASEEQPQEQTPSPRLGWRLGDLLLGRSQQVLEKKSTTSSADSSKKSVGSLEETYTEAYDESGSYLKRVAVEG